MATRRLRLYVVAYLRGLLKPYYENGYSSFVREELILNAISAELDNETRKELHLVKGFMSQNVSDKVKHFEDLYDKVLEFRTELELTPTMARTQKTKDREEIEALTSDPEINSLLARYEILEKSGEIKRLEEKHAKWFAAMDDVGLSGFTPGQKLKYSMNPELEEIVPILDSDIVTDNTLQEG